MLLFMALELGLSWVLFYFRLRTFGKAQAAWMGAYRFWVRIFALAFIVSFAAAMPVLIQLGSLWPGLMDVMGEVAGPLLAAAMLSLFVFKSCFLGAMLFGQRLLSAPMHALVVLMVALGVTVTALCMLTLLAWMHAPTGVDLLDGRYLVLDWAQILASPALPWYAGLFLTSSFVVVACFLIGIVSVQTLRRPATESERLVLRAGSLIAVLALIGQLVLVLGSTPLAATHPDTQHLIQQTLRLTPELSDQDRIDQETQLDWALSPGHDTQAQQAEQTAAPVLLLAAWSLRVALACGAFLLCLSCWTLFRLARFGFDPHTMSHRTRQLLVTAPLVGWASLLGGSAYLFFGTSPYIIGRDILFADVMAHHSLRALTLSSVVWVLLYGFCLYGFFGMVRHVVRFGVVPVARHRGRA